MNNKTFFLSVKRQFRARHRLIGGDWPGESGEHSHLYGLTAEIEGRELDRHGFLIDIVKLNAIMDALAAEFEGKNLNDAPEFAGHNPSLERFCRALHGLLTPRLKSDGFLSLTVRLTEDQIAEAGYRADI